ncbi:MAG: DNA alkylation repair protein [Clostridia bacterium]|nr:DNA alkylation repair protein [Clostridia bacterium]NCC43131.1 DNA alkylation repair protein [Clostridia bacterium]
MIDELRKELIDAADPKYREFHQSLVPGLSTMLGVRMPKLREIAKRTAKGEWQSIWDKLSVDQYEELMLKGLLIGYGKLSREEQVTYLDEFIPKITNWAICDCCCSTWKFVLKDMEFWFEYLSQYLTSEREYEVRAAVVSFLDFYVKEPYLEKLFEIFDSIENNAYYVQMAVAWAVSVCCVKYPEQTRDYLQHDKLDDFTHNKSIQKARESYRISKEEKEQLLMLKRVAEKKKD